MDSEPVGYRTDDLDQSTGHCSTRTASSCTATRPSFVYVRRCRRQHHHERVPVARQKQQAAQRRIKTAGNVEVPQAVLSAIPHVGK